jgi:hypothetical protein
VPGAGELGEPLVQGGVADTTERAQLGERQWAVGVLDLPRFSGRVEALSVT